MRPTGVPTSTNNCFLYNGKIYSDAALGNGTSACFSVVDLSSFTGFTVPTSVSQIFSSALMAGSKMYSFGDGNATSGYFCQILDTVTNTARAITITDWQFIAPICVGTDIYGLSSNHFFGFDPITVNKMDTLTDTRTNIYQDSQQRRPMGGTTGIETSPGYLVGTDTIYWPTARVDGVGDTIDMGMSKYTISANTMVHYSIPRRNWGTWTRVGNIIYAFAQGTFITDTTAYVGKFNLTTNTFTETFRTDWTGISSTTTAVVGTDIWWWDNRNIGIYHTATELQEVEARPGYNIQRGFWDGVSTYPFFMTPTYGSVATVDIWNNVIPWSPDLGDDSMPAIPLPVPIDPGPGITAGSGGWAAGTLYLGKSGGLFD